MIHRPLPSAKMRTLTKEALFLVSCLSRCLPQELAILASIVKHHLRPFLNPIFDVVCDYWNDYVEQ